MRACFHGEVSTVAFVVASLQRALHACMRHKAKQNSKTSSDLHRKCLRKPWKFLIVFLGLTGSRIKRVSRHVQGSTYDRSQ